MRADKKVKEKQVTLPCKVARIYINRETPNNLGKALLCCIPMTALTVIAKIKESIDEVKQDLCEKYYGGCTPGNLECPLYCDDIASKIYNIPDGMIANMYALHITTNDDIIKVGYDSTIMVIFYAYNSDNMERHGIGCRLKKISNDSHGKYNRDCYLYITN